MENAHWKADGILKQIQPVAVHLESDDVESDSDSDGGSEESDQQAGHRRSAEQQRELRDTFGDSSDEGDFMDSIVLLYKPPKWL